MGHLLTSEGLQADPLKIKINKENIVDMLRPQEKAVQRLLETAKP